MEYKVLESYRNKKDDKSRLVFFGTGIVALIASAIIDNTPLGIGGASCAGLAVAEEGMEYMKAYFEAKLDYLKNDKFTRFGE